MEERKEFEEIVATVLELLREKQYTDARRELLELNNVDIAEVVREIIDEVSLDSAIIMFRMLPKDISVDVFSYLSSDDQLEIIDGITEREISYIIDEMDFDDKIDLLVWNGRTAKCISQTRSIGIISVRIRACPVYVPRGRNLLINLSVFRVVRIQPARLLQVCDSVLDESSLHGKNSAQKKPFRIAYRRGYEQLLRKRQIITVKSNSHVSKLPLPGSRFSVISAVRRTGKSCAGSARNGTVAPRKHLVRLIYLSEFFLSQPRQRISLIFVRMILFHQIAIRFFYLCF